MTRPLLRSLSLRARLVLVMSALIGTIAIVTAVYLPQRLKTQAIASALGKGKAIAEVTADSVSPALLFEDRAAAAEAIASVCRTEQVVAVVVRNTKGELFASCGALQSGVIGAREAQLLRKIEAGIQSGTERVGTLTLTLSLRDVHEQSIVDRKGVALGTTVAFVLSILAVMAISSVLTRPLRKIAETAHAIREGNTALRADVTGAGEIGRLAQGFNHMLDSLDTAHVELQHLNRDLELKVAQRTRELTKVLESAYDGIFTIDAKGRCTLLNQSAAELLHYTNEEIIGRDLHTTLHPPGICSDPQCHFAAMLQAGTRSWTKTTFRTQSPRAALSVEVSIAPISTEARLGSVLTFRDVTEREMLQNQLEQATRLSSLGQLAAMLAHEFNNVLMSIAPFVEIIRRAENDRAAVLRACGIIDQGVVRGKRVTQEVLRYTRPADPHITTFDVARWLSSFVAAARVTLPGEIQVTTRVPAGEVLVSADQSQIEQVLTNLVSNARDAMSAGGEIFISLDREPGFVQIAVSDTGHGMDDETAARVFEPFFTTKKLGGTGLGLAVAQQIMTRNGGRISVDSAVGRGTTFRVLIPAATALSVAAAPEPSPLRGSLPRTILLVEDDEAVAAGLVELLQQEGVIVSVAGTGKEALAAIAAVPPEAVLLDVGLPDIDGLTVYRSFSALYPALPVIFSTGHADARNLDEILQQPNVDFLLKPYDSETLLSKLSSLTKSSGGPIIER